MRSHELAAKGSLVSQLKQLSQQHEQLLAAYEGRVAAKLAEAAASGGVLPTGIKRPGGPLVETPEQKRQRQLVDRERRKKELWDEIIRIMDRIRKHNKSEAFRQPVDPIKLKIPDYPIIIKQPMDIGTVLRKLRSTPRAYASPADVAYDVRLIWGNARAYNGALHPVTACANILSEMFEKLWGQANIEHKWQVEVKREEREEQVRWLSARAKHPRLPCAVAGPTSRTVPVQMLHLCRHALAVHVRPALPPPLLLPLRAHRRLLSVALRDRSAVTMIWSAICGAGATCWPTSSLPRTCRHEMGGIGRGSGSMGQEGFLCAEGSTA